LLSRAYLAADRPHDALAVRRLHELNAGILADIAQALQHGDPLAASEAWQAALQVDPTDREAARRLTELDPYLAEASLRRSLANQAPPGDPGVRLRLAEVLARVGRSGEARTLLGELAAESVLEEGCYRLLAELDPTAALDRLQRVIAEGDESGEWRTARAELLSTLGRREEALAALEALLAEGGAETFNRQAARELLTKLDPERGLAHLCEAVRRTPDEPELWSELGDRWLDRGDRPSAVAAWLEAFRRSPGSSEWEERLLEQAPEELILAYQDELRNDGSDELWGDLGDALWRAGRHLEARDAWQRAAAIDHSDLEWTQKLAECAREDATSR
jgi:tetratricopeptide (TPR) repeat protein